MHLYTLKVRMLGCNRCFHIWTWRNPPQKPKQCPNCSSRKWDRYSAEDLGKTVLLFGHEFVKTREIPMGKRTKVRISMELEPPKDEDWIQMYDIHYKCLKCGEAWIGLTDEEELAAGKLDIRIVKQREDIECLYRNGSQRR